MESGSTVPRPCVSGEGGTQQARSAGQMDRAGPGPEVGAQANPGASDTEGLGEPPMRWRK
jgi:hypothetical protein